MRLAELENLVRDLRKHAEANPTEGNRTMTTKAPIDPVWWSCGSGHIELEIRRSDAIRASHPGPCDADIAKLRKVPYIAKQLAEVSEQDAAATVAEAFGDATPEELADHDRNLDRVLWVACGDIAEGVV